MNDQELGCRHVDLFIETGALPHASEAVVRPVQVSTYHHANFTAASSEPAS